MSVALTLPLVEFDASHLIIRPLNADDYLAYRNLRQKILAIGDGKYFSDSYEREKTFITDDQWRDWCTPNQQRCTIGTFNGDQLIGIMGILMYGWPAARTVEWEATWLEPEYRQFGIAKHAYEKVRQWTLDNGYEYAIVFIRADNARSRAIREKQGAIYMCTKYNETWADGSIADVHCFMIHLQTEMKTTSSYDHALNRLNEILDFLKPDSEAMSESEEAA